MDNIIKALDFYRFDGEGAGATASTAGSEQDVKEIQYGKASGSEGAAQSQVGSDKGGQAQDLNAEFAELIGKGGRFHDIYGQKVSDAVKDRFKNQADLQGQVDQIADDLSPLFMNYGLETGDFEGLAKAVTSDDSFFQAAAEREGIGIEQYKKNLQLQAEAERGRRITEAYEREQMKNQMFAQWESEAAQLKEAFPKFDLGLEIESNDRFANLLDNGISVMDAFYATHAGEIHKGIGAEASSRTAENVIQTIQARAARPIENGMNHSAAIQRKSDPSKLSNDDIDEINRRVANGEAISF